jgi:hypothetical protein
MDLKISAIGSGVFSLIWSPLNSLSIEYGNSLSELIVH